MTKGEAQGSARDSREGCVALGKPPLWSLVFLSVSGHYATCSVEICEDFTRKGLCREGGLQPKRQARELGWLEGGALSRNGVGGLQAHGCIFAGIQGLCGVPRSSAELGEISEKCQASAHLGDAQPVRLSPARPSQQRVNSLLYLQLHFKDTKLKQVIYSPHTRKSN